jgi:hypothetical protein
MDTACAPAAEASLNLDHQRICRLRCEWRYRKRRGKRGGVGGHQQGEGGHGGKRKRFDAHERAFPLKDRPCGDDRAWIAGDQAAIRTGKVS